MQKYVRQQYLPSEMRSNSVNYGTKLKQLLLKLALSSLSHEQLTIAGTGAMQGLTLKMQIMLRRTTEGMFTTRLLITV